VCALAGGGEFRAGKWSSHAQTNAEVVERFLPVRIETAAEETAAIRVSVATMG